MKARSRKKKAKVVILQGSPHARGNTAILAGEIARGAAAAGANVTTFFLHPMDIACCAGCQGCQKPGARGCVIRDDMDRIFPAARRADAVVFASPIYWFTVSAQLKKAVDRFYSFMTPKGHRFAGKRIGLAFTFGGDDAFDSGCINAIRTFQDAFAFIQAPIVGTVYGQAGDPGSIRANKTLMRTARELGEKLATGKS